MKKGKKVLGILAVFLLSVSLVSGCGSKEPVVNENVNKVDTELQSKVKAYSEAVEVPLEELVALLDKLEETYHNLGYQRIEKEEGRAQLQQHLEEMIKIQDKLIEAADANSSEEIDKVVSLISGGIYREKASLEYTLGTDLTKNDLNQSLETMRDAKRQVDKGVRDLVGLKQRVGLGE